MIQLAINFAVVVIETDGLNGDTGNRLYRIEEGDALPRIGEQYDVGGTLQGIFMVEHHGKHGPIPRHCRVLARVDKMEFHKLKQDNTWRDSIHEAGQLYDALNR